ncbi:MAG: lysophospholipid acyltransferase family protein, partial [Fusobacteriaceae bacterium]
MYKLQYLLMMGLIKIIKLIPEKSRFSFAEFLGVLVYKTIKKRRIIALANLKLAFP